MVIGVTVYDVIKNILIDKYGIDQHEIKPESNLRNDFTLDSLDEIELTMDAETKYGITISDLEMESATTMQEFVDVVEKHIS